MGNESIEDQFYELLLVDLLDDLVKTGDIDPQKANLIKASYFMDKYLREEISNDPS